MRGEMGLVEWVFPVEKKPLHQSIFLRLLESDNWRTDDHLWRSSLTLPIVIGSSTGAMAL